MKEKKVIRMPNGKIRIEYVTKKKIETASIGPTETATLPDAEPKHVGGGWYELPDGRRVRKSELEE